MKLASEFRELASQLEVLGAAETAQTLRWCAERAEQWAQDQEQREVTVAEAAEISGFSEGQLRRQAKAGRLRNVGSDGEILFLAGDLPRKPQGGITLDGPRSSPAEVLHSVLGKKELRRHG